MRSRDREEMTRALERPKLHAFSIPNDALQSWTRRWRVWGKARPPVFTHVPAALLYVEPRPGVLIQISCEEFEGSAALDPNQIQILWPWILFVFLADDPTWDLDSPRVIG